MRITSVRQLYIAVRDGDITEGMTFTDTTGIYQIEHINGSISGLFATCRDIEDNTERRMTAVDFIGTDF